MGDSLKLLSRQVRACRLCEQDLPLGPRPVIRVHTQSRILVAGQAPGTRVHESGIPFDDPSGDRLRTWMGIDRDTFYDTKRIAILPMGFCYPGTGDWGDLPPMKRCAATWRESLIGLLPNVRLVLAIGLYAVRWHLPADRGPLTELVRAYADTSGAVIPLPHPSPRNNIWLSKNRWFEDRILPQLRRRIAETLNPD